MKIFGIISSAMIMSLTVSAQNIKSEDLYVNTPDGLRLGATLTLPESEQPRALIAMATGSGTQNRDEEVFGHKPFKAIAEALSQKGYGVLRVDDRGIDYPDMAALATNDTFVGDLNSAVSLLDSLFSGKPIGVIGHSEGGITAIKLANRNPEIDFIVTLAGPAWPGDSIVMSQSRIAAVSATGRYDAENVQRRLLDIAKSPMPDLMAKGMISQLMSEQLGGNASMPEVQKILAQQVNSVTSPWYRDFLRYDPAGDIAKVRCKWLALNGSKDVQVLPENLSTIKELNPQADTRLLENLNHLFLKCNSGLVTEYKSLQGDIDPSVSDIIAGWLESVID